MTNNKNAVGYARRSTDMQERSIPDQQAYVEKWAAENGYTVLRWYIDDAISGTSTKDRDAFERMIREAENGRDFETILCYDISRFSRGGTNETGFYLHRLKMANVSAVFCAEGIPEGDEGELLQGVKSWQARQYSIKLSRDCIRGQVSSLTQRHSAPGGEPPYGYDRQHVTASGQVLRTLRCLGDGRKEEYGPDGRLIRVLMQGETPAKKAKADLVKLVPGHPDRVAVVRMMFELCAAGYGSHHIASRFNKEGILSPNGGKWSNTMVRKMLTSPVYKGSLIWNRRTQGKLHSIGRDGMVRQRRGTYVYRNNAPSDWFIVDNVHEPIVPAELFEEVARQIAARRKLNGAAKTGNRALLSGLIVCKHCGRRFGQWRGKAVGIPGHAERTRYYIDKGYHSGGRAVCMATKIPADALDAWVFGKVRQALVGDDGAVEPAITDFVREVLDGIAKPADTSAIKHEMDAINRRIKAMVVMLADPSFEGIEELKGTLADLKSRRDQLAANLDKATQKSTPTNAEDLREWALRCLGQLDKIILSQPATTEARNLIHSVVVRIDIDPDKRRGTLIIASDLRSVFMRQNSTLGTPTTTPLEGGTRFKVPPNSGWRQHTTYQFPRSIRRSAGVA